MRTRRSPYLTLLVLLGFGTSLVAQDSGRAKSLADMSLEELLKVSVVAASRHEQRLIDSPRSISVITAEDIRKHNYRSTPEALNEAVGVLVQETNYAGGSPIIRGLVGNQILILVDGVRLNNAIYRLGPNQYLNTIDVNQIERIEVVRGPGSVLYGSDALGGVVNIVTKSRSASQDGFGINISAFGRYASADGGATGRVELSAALAKLGMIGGVSLKQFGNLRAGARTGLQPFTGYDEWNGDLKLSYQAASNQRFTFAAQHVKQGNVQRCDAIRSGANLKYNWNPERRDLAYLRYEGTNLASFIKNISAVVSYHNQSERYDIISASKPQTQEEHHDEVGAANLGVQLSSPLGTHHLFTYGVEFYADGVESKRQDLNLISGIRVANKGTFADGSTYTSLASFAQDEVQVAESVSLNLGLRYSNFKLKAVLNDPATGQIAINSAPEALTGSAYGLYKITPHVSLTAGVAQGFRAPNVDDATILGPFNSGKGFEFPNPGLKAEQSVDYEVGVKAHSSCFAGTMAYFVSNYKDLIQREAWTVSGLPFLDLNGNGIQDAKEPKVFQRQNSGRSQIRGVEAEGQVRVSENWAVAGNVAWARGEESITQLPLRRIPPTKGILKIQWAPTRRMWMDYYTIFATRQTRLAPGDLTDPRIPQDGTPGFVTLNVRGGINFNRIGTLTLALENITNAAYRLHGSGIDGPGINLIIGYKFGL